jgi:nicotinamidase-related amidase
MSIKTIDEKIALIVIDLQKGIASLPTVHPMAEVVGKASALTEAWRRHGLPIVLVNVTGGAPGRTDQAPRVPGELPADWAELVPELDAQPRDHLVTKRTWGAFTNTDLEAHLRSLGITQVALAGVATSAGVESTARHAHELGFHVVLAVDAMTDMSAEAHSNSIARIFPRLGQCGTTQEILALLDRTPRSA